MGEHRARALHVHDGLEYARAQVRLGRRLRRRAQPNPSCPALALTVTLTFTLILTSALALALALALILTLALTPTLKVGGRWPACAAAEGGAAFRL